MNIKPDLLEFLTNAGHEKLIDIQLESIDAFETHNNVILYSKELLLGPSSVSTM